MTYCFSIATGKNSYSWQIASVNIVIYMLSCRSIEVCIENKINLRVVRLELTTSGPPALHSSHLSYTLMMGYKIPYLHLHLLLLWPCLCPCIHITTQYLIITCTRWYIGIFKCWVEQIQYHYTHRRQDKNNQNQSYNYFSKCFHLKQKSKK
jgi:hypothetical protein